MNPRIPILRLRVLDLDTFDYLSDPTDPATSCSLPRLRLKYRLRLSYLQWGALPR